MTVFGRDASNFDGTVTYAGLGFFTHKATEGISVVHDRYGDRLDAARANGVPVLGAYHVLRSPSAADGSYADQLRFWLGYLDAHTPWWRTHPHFMLQIDAERWPYDNVTAAEVLTFAALVAGSGEPGWKVTYASRGQYGDNLRGIATPLWNADYRGGPSYPGDGWVSSGGQPAGWAKYSDQDPVFLQYTSSGFDHNAYRGTLDQLLQLVEGTTKGTTMPTIPDAEWEAFRTGDLADKGNVHPRWVRLVLGLDPEAPFPTKPDGTLDTSQIPGIKQLLATLDAPAPVTLTDDQLATLAAKVAPLVADELAKRLGNG